LEALSADEHPAPRARAVARRRVGNVEQSFKAYSADLASFN
jgi:hypothetical protein